MPHAEIPFRSSHALVTEIPFLTTSELPNHIEGWLLDCEVRQCSSGTLALRTIITRNLLWFLNTKDFQQLDTLTLRKFFAYLTNGHKEKTITPEGKEVIGRWGSPNENTPLKSSSVATYYRHLRTFCNWLCSQEVITVSPMDKISAPVDRPDQILPFTDEQINALLNVAHKSNHPKRDETLLLFLLDTGLRISEVCGIRGGDIDMTNKSCVVDGKGGKKRQVHFGAKTARALWAYLREETGRRPEMPLFLSDAGTLHGTGLTRSGMGQLIRRLGQAANINTTRCSPHTFRHTFAISFLRNGGNQFTLMQLLGHTNIRMTARYVQLAQADIQKQHRQFSPVDKLKRNKTP